MRLVVCCVLCAVHLAGFSLDELKQNLRHSGVSGKFLQEKKFSDLPTPIQSKGLFYIVNQTLIWETTSPVSSKVKITPEGIYVLEKNKHWSQAQNQLTKQLFLALINLDFDTLGEIFKITLSGDLNAWSVQLKPLGAMLAQFFQEIRISGDRFVRKIVFCEANGDITTTSFLHIQESKGSKSLK